MALPNGPAVPPGRRGAARDTGFADRKWQNGQRPRAWLAPGDCIPNPWPLRHPMRLPQNYFLRPPCFDARPLGPLVEQLVMVPESTLDKQKLSTSQRTSSSYQQMLPACEIKLHSSAMNGDISQMAGSQETRSLTVMQLPRL